MGKKFQKLLLFASMLVFILSFGNIAVAKAETLQGYEISLSTNRAEGSCTYKISGLDGAMTEHAVINVNYLDTTGKRVSVYEKELTIQPSECVDGVYTGQFTMEQFSPLLYRAYNVYCSIGDVTISAKENCDFSIATDYVTLKIVGDTYASERTATFEVKNSDGVVAIPGKNKKIALYVWEKGSNENNATKVGDDVNYSQGKHSWKIKLSDYCKNIGEYNAKVVLEQTDSKINLVKKTFSLAPTAKSFAVSKSAALEKKAAFSVVLKDVKSPVSLKSTSFRIYNSKDKLVATKTAKKSGTSYTATVKMSELDYKLDTYTIKAEFKDASGNVSVYGKTCKAAQIAKASKLIVTKSKEKRTSTFKLKGAYLPGNVKKVEFVMNLYQDGSYKKIVKAEASYEASKKLFLVTQTNKYAGKYQIDAYGYTSWGKKVLLKSQTVKVAKSEAAKNGWFYEKYNGKTYKFYYKDNVKQTDLTKILGLSESNASNENHFYIEINRAACTVTVYAYDKDKKKYIIPVRTFAVSVGRDTRTNAGVGGLNENTSYSPIGTFSICSNGTSAKFTLKPMYEPDGSTCYARWASHIVGNVYFHSIAVGAQSHYALSASNFNRLGSAASAGCIRMQVADAKWIYDYASLGSTVKIVVGDSSHPGPLGKPKLIKISGSINYDPTDPEVPDSRKKRDYKAGLITGYITKAGKRVGLD